jgi:hypothetical protein
MGRPCATLEMLLLLNIPAKIMLPAKRILFNYIPYPSILSYSGPIMPSVEIYKPLLNKTKNPGFVRTEEVHPRVASPTSPTRSQVHVKLLLRIDLLATADWTGDD